MPEASTCRQPWCPMQWCPSLRSVAVCGVRVVTFVGFLASPGGVSGGLLVVGFGPRGRHCRRGALSPIGDLRRQNQNKGGTT